MCAGGCSSRNGMFCGARYRTQPQPEQASLDLSFVTSVLDSPEVGYVVYMLLKG